MATVEGLKDQNADVALFWEQCPDEILLMIFERADLATLATCMFVNTRWRRLVVHVMEAWSLRRKDEEKITISQRKMDRSILGIETSDKHFNMWQELVIDQTDESQQKSKQSLRWKWQQIYYNQVMWCNIGNARIDQQLVRENYDIKKIHTYRDNLIVVSSSHVTYYDADTLSMKRTIEISCIDFVENDHLIMVTQEDHDEFIKIQMFKKKTLIDFNMHRSNVMLIEGVFFYKLDNNHCYVMDHRTSLFAYSLLYPEWMHNFVARFYGILTAPAKLYTYKGEVFFVGKRGPIYRADRTTRSFQKICLDRLQPFQRLMKVFSSLSCSFECLFTVDSITGSIPEYGELQSNDCVLRNPNLSCVTQHLDLLIIGFKNGTLEFFTIRELSRTKALRRLNLKSIRPDVNPRIISIDISENEGFLYLFVAMETVIFQLVIGHDGGYPHCETFIWKVPQTPGILLDFRST